MLSRYVSRLIGLIGEILVPDEVSLVFRLLRRRHMANLPPIMLDVGAQGGSSLRRFALDGWQVFAFEPDPVNRAALVGGWLGCKNVQIDNRAVSDVCEANVTLYRSSASSGISSLSTFHEMHEPACLVDTVTVERFCEDNGISSVEFLKIDAEGHDVRVLRGVPWAVFSPRVVVAEFDDNKTLRMGWSFHDLCKLLVGRGYFVTVSEWYPLEDYGIWPYWRGFKPYPCELACPRAWGNVIAVKHGIDRRALRRLLPLTALRWKVGNLTMRCRETIRDAVLRCGHSSRACVGVPDK